MVSALIFDVDGTLAETEKAHPRAFNEIFTAHGITKALGHSVTMS